MEFMNVTSWTDIPHVLGSVFSSPLLKATEINTHSQYDTDFIITGQQPV